MVDCCPHCSYRFAREEGFLLGAFLINFVATTAGVALVMGVLIAVLASGGSARATAATAVTAVLVAVLVPILFYPFSKTLWAAIDMAMHRGESWAAFTPAGDCGAGGRPAGHQSGR